MSQANDLLSRQLSNMVDRGLISMGWDSTRESIVYFFTPAQRTTAEAYLGDLEQYLSKEGLDD